MEKTMYDLVIIGGGPAGLTAGMYASRARLNTLLIEKANTGGQVKITDLIENYPGFPEALTGPELADRMMEQAQKFGLLIESGNVGSLDLSGSVKKINLDDKTITAHAVIIATGALPRKLGIPGEKRFYGKGVSSCATCDAPLYKDRVVVAVGGGDTAVQESLYLTKFAKKVFLIHRRDQLRATKILQERAFKNDKIEIVWDSVPTEISGFFSIENVGVKNVKTDALKNIAADGCFIWVGITPNTGFLDNSVELDSDRFIITGPDMATSIPGVFAAGDVRATPLRQIATAIGDAAIAAVSAEHYIESL